MVEVIVDVVVVIVAVLEAVLLEEDIGLEAPCLGHA